MMTSMIFHVPLVSRRRWSTEMSSGPWQTIFVRTVQSTARLRSRERNLLAEYGVGAHVPGST
jgi:hypothetical protein